MRLAALTSGGDPVLRRFETAIVQHIVNDFAILAVGTSTS